MFAGSVNSEKPFHIPWLKRTYEPTKNKEGLYVTQLPTELIIEPGKDLLSSNNVGKKVGINGVVYEIHSIEAGFEQGITVFLKKYAIYEIERVSLRDLVQDKFVGRRLLDSDFNKDREQDWKGCRIEGADVEMDDTREDAMLYVHYKDEDGTNRHAEFHTNDQLELEV